MYVEIFEWTVFLKHPSLIVCVLFKFTHLRLCVFYTPFSVIGKLHLKTEQMHIKLNYEEWYEIFIFFFGGGTVVQFVQSINGVNV